MSVPVLMPFLTYILIFFDATEPAEKTVVNFERNGLCVD